MLMLGCSDAVSHHWPETLQLSSVRFGCFCFGRMGGGEKNWKTGRRGVKDQEQRKVRRNPFWNKFQRIASQWPRCALHFALALSHKCNNQDPPPRYNDGSPCPPPSKPHLTGAAQRHLPGHYAGAIIETHVHFASFPISFLARCSTVNTALLLF
jgi:hypothetical protein